MDHDRRLLGACREIPVLEDRTLEQNNDPLSRMCGSTSRSPRLLMDMATSRTQPIPPSHPTKRQQPKRQKQGHQRNAPCVSAPPIPAEDRRRFLLDACDTAPDWVWQLLSSTGGNITLLQHGSQHFRNLAHFRWNRLNDSERAVQIEAAKENLRKARAKLAQIRPERSNRS